MLVGGGFGKNFRSVRAVASEGKLSLGLFLFFCSFQVSPINVTVTKLLLNSTSLEENKETICVSVTRKIPPLWF